MKDVYSIVITDTKEELGFLDMHFESADEFMEEFLKDFLGDEGVTEKSPVRSFQAGGNTYLESDVISHSGENEADIYYLIGIVETPKAFYKVLSWTVVGEKDKYRSDFQKILRSLND